MKKMTEWSMDELKKRKSFLTGFLIVCGILAILILVLLLAKNARLSLFVPVLVLPLTCLPMFHSLKAVNDELKSRTT